MRLASYLAAELRKCATLPAALVAAAVAVLGTLAITILNAVGVRNALAAGRADTVGYTQPAEAVFSAVPLGTVGAVILGVVAVSHEYTASRGEAGSGRQVTTTLLAGPHRTTLLAAKALAVVLLVALTAAVTLPVALALATTIVGPAGGDTGGGQLLARSAGAGLYWALTALMALAVSVLTRSGIVPLIVLIVNASLVSVSYLLSHVSPLAFYLPDLAGVRLFSGDTFAAVDQALPPLAGGVVMAAWSAALLAVAAVVFTRRDA